jgi:hypothetical protein
MSNEFSHDADFDEFGELEDFDEFGEFDDSIIDAISIRTAVLQKNHLVALLTIKTAAEGAAICRVDPREDRPAVQLYDDASKALEWFQKSLRTSRNNGWRIVYDGLPLQG